MRVDEILHKIKKKIYCLDNKCADNYKNPESG